MLCRQSIDTPDTDIMATIGVGWPWVADSQQDHHGFSKSFCRDLCAFMSCILDGFEGRSITCDKNIVDMLFLEVFSVGMGSGRG